MPAEKAIPLLGSGVPKMSIESIFWHDDHWQVQAELRAELLTIPGHAEWYRDDILNRFDLWKRTEGQYGIYTANWNHFIKFRNWNFTTLKEMPSPETVRVLGEMLGTEEDGYEKEETPDYNSWRVWYGQVKAGNRTFSFEGDPQRYNLAGPVREDTFTKGASIH